MTLDNINEEIKKEKEECFLQIKLAEERLEKLRKICKHEKTFEGQYSSRTGSFRLSQMCDLCGELIELK